MDEYISRTELTIAILKAAREAPAADVVEVRHGEWKWDKRFSDYTCSLCGNWDLKTPNYCSNCGAKMDGKRKDGVDNE